MAFRLLHWSFLFSLLHWLLLFISPASLNVGESRGLLLHPPWDPLLVISCRMVGTLNTISADFQICVTNTPIPNLWELRRLVHRDARNIREPSALAPLLFFPCTPSLDARIQPHSFILVKSSLSIFPFIDQAFVVTSKNSSLNPRSLSIFS